MIYKIFFLLNISITYAQNCWMKRNYINNIQDYPLEDKFAGGSPTYIGSGYHILRGSVMCFEDICYKDIGILGEIFVNLYVAVPASNCHPKRCPFGATTICINNLAQVIMSDEITSKVLIQFIGKYSISQFKDNLRFF